jgi:hypothetical protein
MSQDRRDSEAADQERNQTGESQGTGVRKSTSVSLRDSGHRIVAQSAM